ncbi:hypothetical protein BGZ72_004861 [Mortierella alpina]|nr:hypothetical protein BGZ72_004861 [Mortierella alpina]
MHPTAENEHESGNEAAGYDLSMDHPGYSLPITNISYNVDPRERQYARCEAMANKAFQNIMDSYEEYERMTDVFQLEHERREQHERELKEERLRLRRQQKSKKKTGKQGSSAPVPASTASSSSTTPSKAVTPLAFCTPISAFSPSPWSPAMQHGQPRKKRKQYIPVHPAIVNRIPGITLRIQPDTHQGHQHLQVEILKNVDDYQGSHHGYNLDDQDVADMDSIATPLTPLSDESVDLKQSEQSQLQARHDFSRIQKSIESGWPSYSYFPHSYIGPVKCEHAYYQQYPQDDNDVEMHDVAVAPNTLRSLGITKHKRHQSTDSTGRRRSMNRSHENSPSVNGSRSTWPQDVAIAIADLPLSWNNFATRDCQVNTVIGKHDKEFDLLEEVVQEAVARQQAAQQLVSDDESEDESQDMNESIANGDQKARRSSHPKEREGSTTRASTPKAARARTPSNKPTISRSSVSGTARARATRSRTHPQDHDSGTAELVEAYDDIDRAMKAKRAKKRQELMRATSEATSGTSVAAEEDREMEDGDFEGRDINDEYNDMDHVQDGGRELPPSRFKKPPALHVATGEAQDRSSKNKEDTVASPPSPPNSRQVTPAKGESTASSRRPSVSSHARATKTHSRTASISNDAASTPPATPTKSTHTNSPDQRTGHSDRDGSEPSAKSSTSGRTRASGRSLSNVVPADGGTNYFESAMHMIEAKRRQVLAKKRAAAAATDHESTPSDPVDPHELERELEHHLSASEESRAEPSGTVEDVRSAGSNLPKSSRALPGRVLRRVADHDREGRSYDSEPLLDPDCTSCRLELTAKDKASWKQAIQEGDIQLNRRTWSKTAILCNVCRIQYQEHHLRCTQCFFVPVASAIKTLKPGGTCIRCKAGTWLVEI